MDKACANLLCVEDEMLPIIVLATAATSLWHSISSWCTSQSSLLKSVRRI